MSNSLTFKIATEAWEFEQIHHLNYKTFVEEIPQHHPNDHHALIDKFHNQNTYLIALQCAQVVGMVCVRDQRPFSLDHKLENLNQYLPPHQHVCELRLLAIEKEHRNPLVLAGLLRLMAALCEERGYDLALISGTTRQLRLYRHLGFTPFGPLVGPPEAQFQPMCLTLTTYHDLRRKLRALQSLLPN